MTKIGPKWPFLNENDEKGEPATSQRLLILRRLKLENGEEVSWSRFMVNSAEDAQRLADCEDVHVLYEAYPANQQGDANK